MRNLGLALLLATALAAACGTGGGDGEGAPEGGGGEGAFPVTIANGDRPVTVERRPQRVVSLSPTATEMLFALGAGDQVVAVDDNSDFPPEAPSTDLRGFQPSVEAVAGLEPDLVVLSFDPGAVVAGLEALDVPTLLHPPATTLDDAYTQMEQLGAATGNVGEAAEVAASIRADLDRVADSSPARPDPLTYYYELDDTFFTVTSATFTAEVLGLVGLENIADATGAGGSGSTQLSAELIIDQDPEIIFLADTRCCGQSAETVAARPGWDQITAVREGRVIELDDDIASRWGPRVVDLARAAADAAEAVPVGTGR
ncbi:MAG: ABC transporter substrate-binding protein [Acidimicrobiales bacterium]